jgi:hypothetical protein
MQPDRFAATIAHEGFAIVERHLDQAMLEHARHRHADYLAAADIRETRTSSSGGDTRTHIDPDFAGLHALHGDPLLRAVAAQVMKTPVDLRYFLSRTLHPGASPQSLHMDCDPGAPTLLGFIYMLDDFTVENGATQFVAGSHRGDPAPAARLAIAPAGSLIMYDRSVLHGYTANTTSADRRSIQGGFEPA